MKKLSILVLVFGSLVGCTEAHCEVPAADAGLDCRVVCVEHGENGCIREDLICACAPACVLRVNGVCEEWGEPNCTPFDDEEDH